MNQWVQLLTRDAPFVKILLRNWDMARAPRLEELPSDGEVPFEVESYLEIRRKS